MSDGRAAPEEFLERIRAEKAIEQKYERGKLKIFLGYVAGTGKTYAMLEMAHVLKKEGIDVVAGYIEPHDRPDTVKMMEGIEQLPFKMVEYKGHKFREFDLDAALLRKPKVILVDELAHTNVPGCRHEKRYQDIEELLDHGINVYTTVNIQHLESLNDVVENITGVEVKERIPDSVFDGADQVKMVDIEPEELILRMKEGKIYRKTQSARALNNFFKKNKLTALREMALRRMADRVNMIAEQENKACGDMNISPEEHVMVCISPSPVNGKVIRKAARLANSLHANFTALYIENVVLQNMTSKNKRQRDANIKLARKLGAKVVTVFSNNIARQIAEYAKISHVTKIVMGRTNHGSSFRQNSRALSNSVMQHAPGLDVLVVSDEDGRRRRRLSLNSRVIGYFKNARIRDFFLTALICVLSIAIGLGLRNMGFSEANIIMVYLFGIMVTSIFTRGYLCSTLQSVVGVLTFNYFFVMPVHSMAADNSEYYLTFAMLLSVGLISSWSLSKVQRQNEANAKRVYRTEILLNNSRQLRRSFSRQEVGEELASQIQKLLMLTVLFYTKVDGICQDPYIFFRKDLDSDIYEELKEKYTDIREQSDVSWVFENGHRAGCTTHTLPDAEAIYLPVMDGEKVLAVVGMVLEERREIGSFKYDIISAILNEAAFVLERIERIETAKRDESKEVNS